MGKEVATLPKRWISAFKKDAHTFCNSVRVFTENTLAEAPGDFALAFVIAGLDALPDFAAVHGVGFEEDDGAAVEPVCKKVSRPHVGARAGAAGGIAGVNARREREVAGHRLDDGFAGGFLGGGGATEQL